MFHKLRNRFTLIFVGLAVIPLMIVVTVLAVDTFNDLVADTYDDLRELTKRFQGAVEQTIAGSLDDLILLDNAYGFDELSLEQQENLITAIIANKGSFERVSVLESDGTLRFEVSRYGSDFASERGQGSERNAVAQTVIDSKQLSSSGIRFDAQSGEPVLTIGIPFFDLRDGAISSLLLVDFRFRVVWNLVTELEAEAARSENFSLFLTDDLGTVVAYSDTSVVLRGTSFALPEQDGQVPNLRGENSFTVTRRFAVGSTGFVIVVQEHVANALKDINEAILTTAIVTLITLIAAGGLVALTVRQVVRPIEKLSSAASAIQQGNLSTRVDIESKDELGQLSGAFNHMTSELARLIENLEQRVKERTRDLSVAAEVSTQVTRLLDINELLPHLSNLTRSQFGLSHVSVFLYDPTDKALKLAAASGEVGLAMLQGSKKFGLEDKGLVPRAARLSKPVVINNVNDSPEYFPNPLLPHTQSEAALPMRIGERLLGVLDLQSDEQGYFTNDYVNILLTLSEQIAIAVQNAQLFEDLEVARDEAERANKVKSAFLASMSHELRTPLNAIINFSKFLRKGIPGPINEEQTKLLTGIAESGQHLLNLINDVLDMSKIESGSLKLYVEDNIDLRDIIHSAVQYTEPLLTDKPVEMILNLPDALPLLSGDRKRLLQIFLNIFSNAGKFTSEGHIRVQARTENQHIRIEVEDTGLGIAPEDYDKVFIAFLQTESGLRQSGEGTGLGMPITKRLVEAHKGRIWFESQLNRGTTFYVELPMQPDLVAERSSQSA